jgi:hypothetical protein
MNWFYKKIVGIPSCLPALLLFLWLLPGMQVKAENPNSPNIEHVLVAAPPNWSINPDDFEFNMSLIVRVNFNSAPSNNAGNIVGIFVGNELRGVATPISILGDQYFYITAYSNQYFGETLKFRVYYAPNDQIYGTPESVNFIHNSSSGSIGAPFWLNIDPNADYPPELLPILADTTLQNIPFDQVNLLDYLVSVDGDPITWNAAAGPNLNASILNGILTVTPVSNLWTGTELVRIIVTENTPNQLADTIFGSFTVLPDYGPPVWQTIPDQTIFPGDEFSAFDLDDYLGFNGPCRQFDFDVFPFTGSVPVPAWPVVPPGLNPMTVIARPVFVDLQLAGAGAKLAGFVNGNLAGWASPTGVSPNISYSLTLANVGTGKITFQFYDADNQYLYVDSSSLDFVAGGAVGTVQSPYLIQLSPLFPALDTNGEMTIAILDTSWLGAYPIDFIVWDCDYPDTRRDTTQAVFTITNDERPQITSPTTVNFEENACVTLYDTQTSDPNDGEGAGLSYALAGGADEAKFTIDVTTGILGWALGFSPDFENPEDANTDNQYEVNIQVTNSLNLTDLLSLVVTITNQSTEPFEALINGGASAVCTTGNVNLTASGGVGYVWSNGASTALIVVNSPGVYTVTATSNGACTSTASITVGPPPSITASGNNGNVCLGATIQLGSSPSGGTPPYLTFLWSGPNGYSANVEDPAGFPAIAASGGTYAVTVTDAAGCTATATKGITVTANSAPTISAVGNSPVCENANINLGSTPSGGSGIYTQYTWAGPNNYTASTQNPAGFSAILASAGTYTVTITDNAGCSGTGTAAVVVNPKPSILAASNSPVCVGTTVLLGSTASGGTVPYTQYNWVGPNNFSAAVQNPPGFPATTLNAGIYTVTVTDNLGCTASSATTLEVTGLPSITAMLIAPVCTGGMVSLGSTPSGGSGQYASFHWSGPGNYSANVEDPTPFPVTPAVAGNYVVTLTDVSGCTATGSVTVAVNLIPSITAMNNGPVCEGSNITLSSTPSGGSGSYSLFQWTGPDFYVASVADPVPFSTTVASSGIYQVKVTDSEGCTSTATTSVAVNPKPTLTASSNAPICTDGTLNLQSTPSGGSGVFATFNWSGPDNFSSMLEDPIGFPATIAAAGTYRVTVTDNAGCTATASTSVAVSTLNAPSITATSNSPICGGGNLVLNSSPSGGSGIYVTYSWTGPNGYSSNLKDPTPHPVFAPNTPGIYSVTVTDNKNCKGTTSVTVVVNGPSVNASSNSPVCPNGTVQLNGGPVLPGTVAYSWSGPNNYTSALRIPPGFPAIPAAAGNYSLTITQNGCSGVGTTTVVIGDVTPPVIVCPANTTVAANASCSGTVGTHAPASVSDNCVVNPGVTQSPVASTLLNGHNDAKTITLTANDGNGNTASCSFTVTLKDLTPPSLVCPSNMTVAANATCTGVLGSYTPISVSDNCSANPSVVQSPVSTTPLSGHNDVETVTLSANDGNGNTANCSFTVTLKDVTPPSITCPANMTVTADANCAGTVGAHSPVSMSDNCAPNPTATQSPAESTVLSGHNDVETLTLTANDGYGNTANCSFTVTLKDITPPSILCPDNTTVAADANCAGVVGTHSPVTMSDNCAANPTATQSPSAGTMLSGHNDVETLNLTANDGNGNMSACTFTVTLKDVTAPSIICPANTTVAADANCAGVVGTHSPASVSDNCNPNPTVPQSPAANTVLNGHNDVETLTLTANDGNGNLAACTFTVTLKDISPPTVICPANMTVAADATCSGLVGSHGPVSLSDNCASNPTVTQSPASNTVLSGHNDAETITLTANDGNGNTANCTFTVTLKDVTKPNISCPANMTLSADANCNSPLGNYGPVAVSDNCSANPTVTQSPVSSTVLSGHNDLELVTLTADDGNGNTENCSFTVTLKDITAPNIVCKPFSAALNAAGAVTILPTDVYQSGSDNCGTVNLVSVVPNMFTCSNLGANLVTLSANDGNGNSNTCSATVTVVDLILPTMVCKNATVMLNAAGTGSITPADINNNSTDNCTLANLNVTPNTFNCANLGANLVTLTGTDQSGNTATCQGTVTVVDNIAPTMICKNATLNLNNVGQVTLTLADINNGSFDNCTIVQLSLSQTQFTCANIGNNTVVLTGIDQSGNVSTCTATVTVRDLIAPMAKCKNATANLNNLGMITVLPTAVDNGSSDNCSFTLSLTPASFTCANIGLNTVTLSVTDNSGNTSTCTARVTVKDVTPPTALCKNFTIFLNDLGHATLTTANVDNGSTDNCGITSKVLLQTNFNCSDIGAPVNNFLTVTDGSGNSATCTALITVKDVFAPTAICKNTTVPMMNGSASVYPSILADSSFDNCSITSYLPVVKTYYSPGVYNLPITVKDWSGNAANCTSVVTVTPNGPSENNADPKFKLALHPNPTEGPLNLEFELPEEQVFEIAVFNLAGKLVVWQKGSGAQGANTVSLQMSDLKPGIYFLEVRSEQLKARKRLVLQK